jgi:GxxExxY protein
MENPNPRLLEGDTTGVILDSFREVHRTLGFGYREYIYSRAMERELRSRGATVEREVMVMVYYKGEPLAGQTVDMLVNGKVMVENKAKEKMPPGTTEQLFSYLCCTDFEVGLVLNFGRVADFHRASSAKTDTSSETGRNPNRAATAFHTLYKFRR